MNILKFLKLAPSEKDLKLIELVKNSYKSLEVIGRGTVRIDPEEVSASSEFKNAKILAKTIVQSEILK